MYILLTGHFNVRSTNWGKNDLFKCIFQFNSLTTSYGLSQIFSDLNSSCIDLIFTYHQPNLVIQSGFYPSLHPKRHHQINYAKFNLKVEYPPLYKPLTWVYKNADIRPTNSANDIFDWGNSFEGKMFMNKSTLLKRL